MRIHELPSDGPRVLIVSGSVGAGHDGVARELAVRLTDAGVVVEVRDFLDAVPRPVAALLREGYAGTVAHAPLAFEFLFRRLESRGVLWNVERSVCARAEAVVAGWAREFCPDVVVSTYPLASQTLGELRGDGRLAARVVTYLTDPAAHVSWVHPAVDHHLTVTSATAEQGALRYGLPFEVAGPLVPARFASDADPVAVATLRRELTAGEGPVALLVAGSLGLGDMVDTVDDVSAAGVTALVLCGRNEHLRRRLEKRPRTIALGWRTDVHRLMQAADVLVQNAGGLSFTEALVAGLPAVTYRPIPGHGRANAGVLDDAGLAPWARSREELGRCLVAQASRQRTPQQFPDPADLVLGVCRPAVLTGRAA